MMSSPLDFDEALQRLLSHATPPDAEPVSLWEADGRVLARSLVSTLDVPPWDNAQMDGYAVRAGACVAGRSFPVSQRIPAGHPGQPLTPGTVARIFTGAAMPEGADAVVMQEDTEVEAEGHVRIAVQPKTGEWVRRRGEDIRRDSIVLSAGTRLTPAAIGLAASVGAGQLLVHRRIRVACFFTGDELVMPGEPLPPGGIYNSNRFVLRALLQRLGCEVLDLGIVPDDFEATRAALRRAAASADLLITAGGISVGEEDHVRPAVQAEGELDLWRVAIKPGKPLAYGRLRRPAAGVPAATGCDEPASGVVAQRGEAAAIRPSGDFAHFIGLPGNPVSAFVTFLMLVRPFLLRLQGVAAMQPRAVMMVAGFDWLRPDTKRREFLRAVQLPDARHLDLFRNQGSGVLTSAVVGDGLIDNPPGKVIRRGDVVRFIPFSELLS